MSKPTFESLMNMNTKELAELRTKSMDAAAIIRNYKTFSETTPKPTLIAYDYANIITTGIGAFGVIGAAAIGFLAVKYYTDKKYKENKKIDVKRS